LGELVRDPIKGVDASWQNAMGLLKDADLEETRYELLE
jgi:hypothetical protein